MNLGLLAEAVPQAYPVYARFAPQPKIVSGGFRRGWPDLALYIDQR
jgi:hypothetical protein